MGRARDGLRLCYQYRFSLSAVPIAFVAGVAIKQYVEYLYYRGEWVRESDVAYWLEFIRVAATALSVALAIIGLRREPTPAGGITAIVFALFFFMMAHAV